ncbi:uncharacterized protein LOC108151040 [Drosophila miranda]|uniref:uncharacterized protein LOC108151040 n=1 Tax=Drosophila miranda TaxID=7229 RepID=UPI0007E78F0E|nr:uncharacterized protein LOC108151040 [Drosophila miranda]
MWKLLLLFGCLLPGHQVGAAFLQECQGVIINKVTNPDQSCSEFVHCNGDDSYYCNGDCLEPVYCYGANEEQIVSPAPEPAVPENPKPDSTSAPTTSSPRPSYTISPTSAASTASTASTAAPAVAATTISSTDVHVICKTSGRNKVYPYPANINYYYQCMGDFLLIQQCPQNFHFDAAQEQCIATKPYRMIRLFM